MNIKKIPLLIFSFSAFFALSGVSSAFAANTPTYQPSESSCDGAYYETLKSRAWLEAQREITQNQNLILKPHSVLEYSCFRQYVDVLKNQTANMFSESAQWGDAAGDIGPILDGLVYSPLDEYNTANFNHGFMGGRRPMDIPAGDGGYNCGTMNLVWEAAKCMNFIDNPDQDGFIGFADYRDSDDKRKLPSACEKVDMWKIEMLTALGTDLDPDNRDKWFKDKSEVTPWHEDQVKTFFAHLGLNREGPDDKSCGDGSFGPFETGLIVYRKEGNPKEYKEKICTMPGCYYKPKENSVDDGECLVWQKS